MALLVVAVGLLAVFGLFPDGLSASRKSVESTEMAAFADYVFDSIAMKAALPETNWDDIKNGLTLVGTHALNLADQPVVKALGPYVRNRYYWEPNYYGGDASDPNKLFVDKYITASFTYSLDIGTIAGTELKYARLEVWPGFYPDNNPPVAGTIFYCELAPVK